MHIKFFWRLIRTRDWYGALAERADCRPRRARQSRSTSNLERHKFRVADSLPFMREVSFVSNHAVLNFKFCRSRAHVNGLVRQLHELVEIERPIIERAGQAKPIIDEHRFARAIAFIHPTDLRDRGVRFIDDYQEIFRKKVDDRVRLRTRRPPREMARVIFDPVTESHFLQHFQIVFSAHSQALRFQKFVLRL